MAKSIKPNLDPIAAVLIASIEYHDIGRSMGIPYGQFDPRTEPEIIVAEENLMQQWWYYMSEETPKNKKWWKEYQDALGFELEDDMGNMANWTPEQRAAVEQKRAAIKAEYANVPNFGTRDHQLYLEGQMSALKWVLGSPAPGLPK